MARSFNGSVTIRCDDTLGPAQLTMAIYASSNSIATIASALAYTNQGAADSADVIYFRGDTGGDPVQYRFSNGVGAGAANHGSAYSAGVIYHLCSVRSSATSHSIFRDGTGKVTSATNVGAAATTRILIGAHQYSPPGITEFLDGLGAMAALWSAALTDDEVAALGKGFPPRRVRPQSLFFYAPLVRDVLDWRGRAVLTDTGTSVADHPRCYGF